MSRLQNSKFKRTIALLMVMVMLINELPLPLAVAWAKDTYFQVVNELNEVVQEDESWEELYPNGTFAFAEAQVSMIEGGEEQSLHVLRLGGGLGEAKVIIHLTAPADKTNSYYAASTNDYVISEQHVDLTLPKGDPYGSVVIELDFAENEYEKQIGILPIDDDEAEITEFLLATIVGVEGAEFTETANRATLIFNDNEEIIPSMAGFIETAIIADRNKQNAQLIVQRTGGIQYPFSVYYLAGDNTAVVGMDYAPTEGTLFFEPGETEKTIFVPLVQNYVYLAEPEISFFVGLDNAYTGEINHAAAIAGVHLINSYGEESLQHDEHDDDELSDDIGDPIIDPLLDPDIMTTPNLITLLAMDNGNRVQPIIMSKPLIANTKHEQKTSAISASAFMPQMMSTAIVTEGAFTNDASYPWKPYLEYADYNNSYDGDKGTLSFNLYSSQGKLAYYHNTPTNASNYYRVSSDSSDDPFGFAMSTQDIPNLYEYYATLIHRTSFDFDNIDNRGYFGLGRAGIGDNDTSIANKLFYIISRNATVASGSFQWFTVGQISSSGVALKSLVNATGAVSGTDANNSIQNKRVILGLYDYSSRNNSKFTIDLDTFVLRRATPKNLVVEYSSSDQFVDTDSSRFAPSLKVTEGGIDPINGHPYIGSTVSITANSNAGAYRIKEVNLSYSTSKNGTYTVINSVGRTSDSQTAFNLKIASNASIESERLALLSCMNYDTYYYKIDIVYEAQKTLQISIADALKTASTSLINSPMELLSALPANLQNDASIVVDDLKLASLIDVSYLNLNLDADYRIIYDGKIYEGNQTIALAKNTDPNYIWQLTHKDLLSKAQEVKVKGIQSIEIYADIDHNSMLDGSDILLAVIRQGKYDEQLFTPETIDPHGVVSKLMVVYYTLQPYAFVHDGNPELLPDGTVYSQEIYFNNVNPAPVYMQSVAALAPEMLTQRQISVPSDNIEVPIFGASAASGHVVIPLGGDMSASEGYDNQNNYNWAPSWRGNLSTEGTALFAGASRLAMHHEVLGELELTSSNSQALNYLGSFHAFDTPTLHLSFKGKIMDTEEINVHATRKFIPIAFTGTPTVETATQEKVPEDMGNNMSRSAQPKIGLPDLNLDLGVFGLSYSGDEILISAGITVFNASKSSDNSGGTNAGNNDSQGQGYFSSQLQNYGDALEKLKEFMQMLKAGSAMQMAPKADFDVDFEVGFSINILLTYNETEGKWLFDSALFLVRVGGAVSISQKLPAPVSFIYVYVVFGADVTIATGLGMKEVPDVNGKLTRTVYFKGIIIEPKMYAEIGAGIGLDNILAIEIYFKMNIGMKATLASYEETKGNEATANQAKSSFDTFSLRGALGFRVEIIIFTYEMDVVGFLIEYDRKGFDNNKLWRFSPVLFEQSMNLSPFLSSAADLQHVEAPPAQVKQIIDKTEAGAVADRFGSKLYLSSKRADQQIGALGTISGTPSGIGGDLSDELATVFAFNDIGTTDDGAFSFGNYNTDSAAYKVGDNLNNSSKMKMVEVAGRVFVFYHVDDLTRNDYNTRKLVFSELDTTTTPYALVHPDRSNAIGKFMEVDNDLTADTEFDVVVLPESNALSVVWINQKSALDSSDFTDLSAGDIVAKVAENTEVKKVILSVNASDVTIPDTSDYQVLSKEVSGGHEYAPKLTVRTISSVDQEIVTFMQTSPYTSLERDDFLADLEAEFRLNSQYLDEDILTEELYFKSLLMSTFGKHASLNFTWFNSYGEPYLLSSEPAMLHDNVYAEDTTISGLSLTWLDDHTISYSYVIEIPGKEVNGEKYLLKNLYLGFAEYDGNVFTLNGTSPKLIGQLIDYLNNDKVDANGVVQEGVFDGNTAQVTTIFPDPFYVINGFGPDTVYAGDAADFFFNMNGRHYNITAADLLGLANGSISFSITPLFPEVEGIVGDGKTGIRLAQKSDGSLVVVTVEKVAYTENNALFIYEYDNDFSIWGEGRPLAMRGLEIYEKVQARVYSSAEAEVDYFSDQYQLTFSNPQILMTGQNDLIILTETSRQAMADLAFDIPGDSSGGFSQRLPELENNGDNTYTMKDATKQFYAIKYVSGAMALGNPQIWVDGHILPGSKVDVYVKFTNTGTIPVEAVNTLDLFIHDGTLVQLIASQNLSSKVYPVGYTENIVFKDVQFPSTWAGFNSLFNLSFSLRVDNYSSSSPLTYLSYSSPLGIHKINTEAEIGFEQVNYQTKTIVEVGNKKLMNLDLNLTIANHGLEEAQNVYVHAYVSKVDPLDASQRFLEDAMIFNNQHFISIGSISSGSFENLVFDNDDYTVLGEALVLNTANDLCIPEEYFTNGDLDLVLMLGSNGVESDYTNNTTTIRISNPGYIVAPDYFDIEKATGPMEVRLFSMGNTPVLELKEIYPGGKEVNSVLRTFYGIPGTDGSYLVNMTTEKTGQTILRLSIAGTSIFKDVIINSNADTSGFINDKDAPVITILSAVPARDAFLVAPFEVMYSVTELFLAGITDPFGTKSYLSGISSITTLGSFTIAKNGAYSIMAWDVYGNVSTKVIEIYGFNEYEETLPVSEHVIKDVSLNNLPDLMNLPYLNNPFSLRFTTESQHSLSEIQVLRLADAFMAVDEEIFSTSFASGTAYRYVSLLALRENGSYKIISRDHNGSEKTLVFSIDTIDTIAPDHEFVLTGNNLDLVAYDNMHLAAIDVYLDNQLLATINQGLPTEMTGVVDLPSYGNVRVQTSDMAGNVRISNFVYAEQTGAVLPTAKIPVPTMTVEEGKEMSFSAADIAESSDLNDNFFVDSLVSITNTSSFTAYIASDGRVVVRGLKAGYAILQVVVGNTHNNFVTIDVPITVQKAQGNNPIYISPNTSSPVQEEEIQGLTITVADVRIRVIEQNKGQQLTINLSGDQLQKLANSGVDPLVFDFAGISPAAEIIFTRSNLRYLAEAKKSLVIKTVARSFELDTQSLLSLCEELRSPQITFLIVKLDETNIPEELGAEQKAQILKMLAHDIPVYSVTITSGDEYLHTYVGTILIHLPYEHVADSNRVIKLIDELGQLMDIVCTIDNSQDPAVISFQAPHFSIYAIDYALIELEGPIIYVDRPSDYLPIVLTIDSLIVRCGDDELVAPPIPPQIVNDRTMLPFRYLIQTLLGGIVHWDEATRSITAEVNGVTFAMTIDDVNIRIDGEEIVFDQAPIIDKDHTLVPLRVFEDVVEYLEWQAASRTVIIYP